MDELQKEYFKLLDRQVFKEADLDYSLLEQHKSRLEYLAEVSNSGITVFDLYRKLHVFASANFIRLFGYYVDGFDDRVHPDDMKTYTWNGIEVLKFMYANKSVVKDYKMISEYRIRIPSNQYMRVIEQFSLLEADNSGNPWLSLSVIDISPDQSAFKGVTCGLLNCRTGEFFPVRKLYMINLKSGLSPREIEILQLIKEGKLSKEISERLFISVHTVNTHRQHILEKLDADNSMEAVKYASMLGLLN
jgi:DNA-binding CsgD family transcriptional regulator